MPRVVFEHLVSKKITILVINITKYNSFIVEKLKYQKMLVKLNKRK